MRVEIRKKCRICLFIGESDLIDWNSMVEECFEDIKTYRDCFQICTGLATTESDELPKMLCHTCAIELKEVYKFIIKARKSNEKLLELEKTRRDYVFEEFIKVEDLDPWPKDEPQKEEPTIEEPIEKSEPQLSIEEPDVEPHLLEESREEKRLLQAGEVEKPEAEESVNKAPLLEEPEADVPLIDPEVEKSLLEELEVEESDVEESLLEEHDAEESLLEEATPDFPPIATKKSISGLFKVCEYCNKEFPANQLLKHIRKDHTPSEVLCHLCPRTCKDTRSLQKHLLTHEVNRERKYPCEICDRKFMSKKTYNVHVKSHDLSRKAEFECDQCEKSFLHKSSLKLHHLTHTKKMLECPICRKLCLRTFDLEVHLRSHSGDTPYICPQCGKGFSQSGSFNKHLRIHEGHLYKCDICSKQYKHQSTLIQHRREHLGLPLMCSLCGNRFGRRSKVQQHIVSVHKVEDLQEIDKLIETIKTKKIYRGRMIDPT